MDDEVRGRTLERTPAPGMVRRISPERFECVAHDVGFDTQRCGARDGSQCIGNVVTRVTAQRERNVARASECIAAIIALQNEFFAVEKYVVRA